MVFFRVQKKVEPRPDWSPLAVSFKISDEHPRPFHMEASHRPCSLFPGPLIGLYTHVLSRAVDWLTVEPSINVLVARTRLFLPLKKRFISFRHRVISPIYHDNSTDTIARKFVTQPKDVTTAENTNATISCVAIGSSPVTYTWTHNGTMLTLGSNTGRYRLMGADGNLTVINVTWNDAGVYRCIARSSMGSALSLKAVIRIACEYYPSL